MTILDILRRSFKNIKKSKTRTILTVLSISIGACALTLTLGIGEGGRRSANQYADSQFNPLLFTVSSKYSLAREQRMLNGIPVYNADIEEGNTESTSNSFLTTEDIQTLKGIPNVYAVIKDISISPMYIQAEGSEPLYVIHQIKSSLYLLSENIIAGSIKSLEKDEISIPEAYVKALNFSSNEDALGKEIIFRVQDYEQNKFDYRYKVAFVTDNKKFNDGSAPFYMNENSIEEIYDKQSGASARRGEYSNVNVIVNNKESLQEVMKTVNSNPKFNAYYLNEEQREEARRGINIVQIGLLIFSSIVLLASLFGVVNTQLMSVFERTQEIGLMKALGMSRKSIFGVFSFESMWIGFLGAICGALLAILLGTLANIFLPILARDFTGINAFQFVPWQILIMVVILMLISLLSGLLPARKAAKLDPIKALRAE